MKSKHGAELEQSSERHATKILATLRETADRIAIGFYFPSFFDKTLALCDALLTNAKLPASDETNAA